MNRMEKQTGATLVVSLVMLLVLTLAGMSAVENVSLQSLMARNSTFQIHTYQVALSEINAQLVELDEDISPLTTTLVSGTLVQPTDEIEMQPDDFTQTVQYDYIGEGTPPPGYSVDTFTGHLFELNSTAQVDNTGIGSDQTQGLNFAGPK